MAQQCATASPAAGLTIRWKRPAAHIEAVRDLISMVDRVSGLIEDPDEDVDDHVNGDRAPHR
jgi:hypothetical protein